MQTSMKVGGRLLTTRKATYTTHTKMKQLMATSDAMKKARRRKLWMRLFCNADREWNAKVLSMCVTLCAVLLVASVLTAVVPLLWGSAENTADGYDYTAHGLLNISNTADYDAIAGTNAIEVGRIADSNTLTGTDATEAGHSDGLSPFPDEQHDFTGYAGIAWPTDETGYASDIPDSEEWESHRVHDDVPGSAAREIEYTGTTTVELVDWTTARDIVQNGEDIQVVDVRTGVVFFIRSFSIGGHADVEPITREDTDAILYSRNGVWAWAPRPVWVTIGERTFAASLNGMPHGGGMIHNNGMNGHLCLHFNNTRSRNKRYESDLNAAVIEAWEASLSYLMRSER
jgi:hypothetical protein